MAIALSGPGGPVNRTIPAKYRKIPQPARTSRPKLVLPKVGKGVQGPGKIARPVSPPPVTHRGIQSPAPIVKPAPTPKPALAAYVNPFAGQNVTPQRIDQGVDYSAPSGTPIRALGAGTITSATARGSGWPGGGFIEEKLSGGPLKGQTIYTAENVSPTVQAGQTVKAGQQIGVFTGGIETGFGNARGDALASGPFTYGGKTYPTQSGLAYGSSDPGAYPTALGVAFSNLVGKLGGPRGVMTSNTIHGTVPAVFNAGGPVPKGSTVLPALPAQSVPVGAATPGGIGVGSTRAVTGGARHAPMGHVNPVAASASASQSVTPMAPAVIGGMAQGSTLYPSTTFAYQSGSQAATAKPKGYTTWLLVGGLAAAGYLMLRGGLRGKN